MNKTCRECGQDEHTGECRPDKLQAERDASIYKVSRLSRELGEQDFRIADLERINEAHHKENDRFNKRIEELEEQLNSARLQINGVETIEIFMNGKKTVFVKEELMPTKEEAQRMIDCLPLDDKKYWEHCIGWEDEFEIFHNLNTKLQKIIGE